MSTLASIVNDLNKIANVIETQSKKAYSLFSIGDMVVCLNPLEGVCKGQKYRIISFPNPGYIKIEDVYGKEIGVFKAERFCLDNQEY